MAGGFLSGLGAGLQQAGQQIGDFFAQRGAEQYEQGLTRRDEIEESIKEAQALLNNRLTTDEETRRRLANYIGQLTPMLEINPRELANTTIPTFAMGDAIPGAAAPEGAPPPGVAPPPPGPFGDPGPVPATPQGGFFASGAGGVRPVTPAHELIGQANRAIGDAERAETEADRQTQLHEHISLEVADRMLTILDDPNASVARREMARQVLADAITIGGRPVEQFEGVAAAINTSLVSPEDILGMAESDPIAFSLNYGRYFDAEGNLTSDAPSELAQAAEARDLFAVVGQGRTDNSTRNALNGAAVLSAQLGVDAQGLQNIGQQLSNERAGSENRVLLATEDEREQMMGAELAGLRASTAATETATGQSIRAFARDMSYAALLEEQLADQIVRDRELHLLNVVGIEQGQELTDLQLETGRQQLQEAKAGMTARINRLELDNTEKETLLALLEEEASVARVQAAMEGGSDARLSKEEKQILASQMQGNPEVGSPAYFEELAKTRRNNATLAGHVVRMATIDELLGRAQLDQYSDQSAIAAATLAESAFNLEVGNYELNRQRLLDTRGDNDQIKASLAASVENLDVIGLRAALNAYDQPDGEYAARLAEAGVTREMLLEALGSVQTRIEGRDILEAAQVGMAKMEGANAAIVMGQNVGMMVSTVEDFDQLLADTPALAATLGEQGVSTARASIAFRQANEGRATASEWVRMLTAQRPTDTEAWRGSFVDQLVASMEGDPAENRVMAERIAEAYISAWGRDADAEEMAKVTHDADIALIRAQAAHAWASANRLNSPDPETDNTSLYLTGLRDTSETLNAQRQSLNSEAEASGCFETNAVTGYRKVAAGAAEECKEIALDLNANALDQNAVAQEIARMVGLPGLSTPGNRSPGADGADGNDGAGAAGGGGIPLPTSPIHIDSTVDPALAPRPTSPNEPDTPGNVSSGTGIVFQALDDQQIALVSGSIAVATQLAQYGRATDSQLARAGAEYTALLEYWTAQGLDIEAATDAVEGSIRGQLNQFFREAYDQGEFGRIEDLLGVSVPESGTQADGFFSQQGAQ
jgi:hypothetical protein